MAIIIKILLRNHEIHSHYLTAELKSLHKREELWINQECKNTGCRLDVRAYAKAGKPILPTKAPD